MADPTNPLIDALAPLASRLRTDATATRQEDGSYLWHANASLTRERIAAHLNGGPVRGLAQIKAGEDTLRVAVLDFDDHKGAASWPEMSAVVARVADVLETAYELEPVLFRSGGGNGVHLYLLWDEPQDAYSVRELLKEALAVCGLSVGTRGVREGQVEIYPKRDSVAPGKFGNQVMLPGARASAPLEIIDEDPLW